MGYLVYENNLHRITYLEIFMLWHNLHRKWDEMGTYYPVSMWIIVNSHAAWTLLDRPSHKRLCMRFTTAFRAAICAWVKGLSKTRCKKLLSPALTIRMLLILCGTSTTIQKSKSFEEKKHGVHGFLLLSRCISWNNGSWKKKHLYPLKTSPSGAISITCNRAKRPKTLETCAVGHGMGSKWDTRRCQKLGDPAVVGQFYPLVNIQKTMENHHFLWENQL